MTPDEEAAVPPPATAAETGGESPCALDRVCAECGRIADAAPPTTCPRCGASVGR
ncbi:hypothetical protein N566_19445 [Streptomycetaceae bacterium MP113-05]|nr:hypothetical protein N566_19445 [Streptomycetaceae bacterium MP113-05]